MQRRRRNELGAPNIRRADRCSVLPAGGCNHTHGRTVNHRGWQWLATSRHTSRWEHRRRHPLALDIGCMSRHQMIVGYEGNTVTPTAYPGELHALPVAQTGRLAIARPAKEACVRHTATKPCAAPSEPQNGSAACVCCSKYSSGALICEAVQCNRRHWSRGNGAVNDKCVLSAAGRHCARVTKPFRIWHTTIVSARRERTHSGLPDVLDSPMLASHR